MEAVELILAVYPDAAQAGRTLQRLRQMEKDGGMRLFNRAVISKDETGKAHISEGQDVNARGGALFGALVGGLVGLLGGPVGAVIGAAAGAATGGMVSARTDLGFSDSFLQQIQTALKPGSSAVLILVEIPWADAAARTFKETHAKVFRHALQDDLVRRLHDSQHTS